MHIAPTPDPTSAFAAIWPIYTAVIDRTEQKTEPEFRAALANRDYALILASEAGRTIGFSLAWSPPDAGIALLEYLAVAPDAQSSGIGAALAHATFAHVARPTLIEADDAAGHAPTSQQARRLRFYARQNCRHIAGLNYLLPLDHYGTPAPMLLLTHNAPDAIPRATLRAWLTRIYTDCYAQRADDPRIATMLGDLPEEISVAPIPEPHGSHPRA